jgi:hypothetical protein
MTGDQSRHLKVGDRVCWRDDKVDGGTVTERNWAGVTIEWDNRSAFSAQRYGAGNVGTETLEGRASAWCSFADRKT